ncbi:CbiX/SirB N-terminal domain-containing protein [uncultured Aliiroseovarius sp.]|uniref:CbiX/SirB N-terminal domain-containing protein n=1 Tax=uncultured Aliiroseovarius sp. TaxID=1658783 RepID=UPI002599B484|nr:CbiX/SirB N-terminal domain-containing protein [uncultured Aliiroseovarius sp.]
MTQIDALIVSHGQPSSPDPAEAALADYVAKVQAHVPDLRLGSATLAKPGSLEAQLEHMAPDAVVYPLFMSDGWFVRSFLTKRLGDAPYKVMPPFGMDPNLPELSAKGLRTEGLTNDAPLLLVAHGSGSGRPAPQRAAEDFAAALTTALGGAQIAVSFLEQSPTIPEVMADLPNDILCLPFFAMEGDHVRQDVHEELGKCAYAGRVLPVMSQLPGVDGMVANAIKTTLADMRNAAQAAPA